MRNPYEVLGIKERSSTEEVNTAYRELAKKYYQDQYGDIQPLQEEKMREIKEAYDYLIENPTGSGLGEFSSLNNLYESARRSLENGDISVAEDTLNYINERDAEWNFLMGVACMKKGWHDDAITYLNNACNQDQSNKEYEQALYELNTTNNSYKVAYNNRSDKKSGICGSYNTEGTMCECFGECCGECCGEACCIEC